MPFVLNLLVLVLLPALLFAFPVTEKTPATESAPLDILSSQPDKIIVPSTGDFKDKFMIVIDGTTTVEIIDLETWASFSTQPDDFTDSIVDATVLKDGTTVILALSDGNLAKIDLSDTDSFANTEETTSSDEDEEEEEEDQPDSRRIDIAEKMSTAGISFITADTAQNKVYMIASSGLFFEYNVDSNSLSEVEITIITTSTDDEGEETTSETTPSATGIVFADSSGGDKVLIPTSAGQVIVIEPGSASFNTVELDTTAVDEVDANFADIALTPDHDHAFITDTTNDVIWVFSVRNEVFVDQQSSGTSLDPIEIDSDANSSLTNVLVFEDTEANTVAYVSGASGISVADADDSDSSSSSSKVTDVDESAGTDEDPITLSGTPGPLAATSSDAEYIFSANGDAAISVITDNPWITISSTSATEVTSTSSTFTLTFQTDTAGTYTIRANSNPGGESGVELIGSITASDADTDTTTATIDINSFSRDSFIEGSNKIFVLVTDDSGNIGHTATLIKVDRPPEPITITGVNFGNKKAYIVFTPSPDEDIATYELFAEPAESQANPNCPGTLTFESASTVSGSFSPSNCSNDTCKATITQLTNDLTYCVAVNTVDEAGQESGLATFGTAVTPEQTMGPAGFLGETSCALHRTSLPLNCRTLTLVLLVCTLVILFASRWKIPSSAKKIFCLLFPCLLFSTSATAAERTPQNWTLEVKGLMWIPTDAGVKSFVGTCCSFGGEVEFGWLYKSRLNVTVTGGMGYDSGSAIGINSGGASEDNYTLLLFPVRADVIYRFDCKSEQVLLPYVRAGADAVMFRENTAGEVIKNTKFGLHGGGGLGILLDRVEPMGHQMEHEAGINDVYLTLEGRYAMISSFKTTGLDLSGFYPYVGVLFEF